MKARQFPARPAARGAERGPAAGDDGAAAHAPRPLDGGAKLPLYRQLLGDLRRRILAGAFDHDRQLPSEAQIEASYGVSRITVRRALQELAQEGLIERHQGRATRLAPHHLQRPAEAALEGGLDEILALGFQAEAEVLESGEAPATAEVAGRLAVTPGAPVHRSLCLRRLDGRPLCRLLSYLPLELARRVPTAALDGEPLLLLVRDGLVLGRVEQSLAAVAATAELATSLELSEGAPLLLIERLFRDERDRPVQLVQSHFRADRYRYGMSFRTAREGEPAGEATRVRSLSLLSR